MVTGYGFRLGLYSGFPEGVNPFSGLPRDCYFQNTHIQFQFTGLLSFLCFSCWLQKSWSHSSVVPNCVVFGEIVRQVFLYFLPLYVEIIL